MKNVILVSDHKTEAVCRDAINIANSCQSDFSFYLLPPIKDINSPLVKPFLEYDEGLYYLDNKRSKQGYEKDDLLIAFYNGELRASKFGLSNLFIAGTKSSETPSCVVLISLKYLDGNVLEDKYNYLIQKHSILHLILSSIIVVHTNLETHNSSYGCLLDFNNNLASFNRVLQKGYYLCSSIENNCYERLLNNRYGNSIIRMCIEFKNKAFSSEFQLTINKLVMGDENTFNNSQIGAVGSHATASNNTFQQVNNQLPLDINFSELSQQLSILKSEIKRKAETSEELEAVLEVSKAEDASKQQDGNQVIKHLKAAGTWVFTTAKDIGVDIVTDLIKKQIGA
ncbi:hypothetical protein ACFPMF_15265 [Larkinella bovis]|uniref:Uncharacterized protein n=1 Tax=Larkinella bovis TaxID=683041 RepID=A0ABW0IB21_9BACT